MEAIRRVRKLRKFSQRELSRRAGLSFKGLQLLEMPGHDARISTLEKVAEAFGLPQGGVRVVLDGFLTEHPASAFCASLRIVDDGFESWKVHLFDFVDRFRSDPSPALVHTPPVAASEARLAALFASTVDALCREQEMETPDWSSAVGALPHPWFVSATENLKASALVESPVWFRRRNIFVLANFLSRA